MESEETQSPSAPNGANTTGLEQLQMLLKQGPRPGIAESLDFNLTEVEHGMAVFSGVPGRHAYNPIGSVHGGYAATLLDSACGCAVHSMLKPNQRYTTLELKVSYHKGVTDCTGLVRAKGRVLSFGKRVAFAEAVLTGSDGTLYASATSTLLLSEK